MNYPILYKRTNTGAIQSWCISSSEHLGLGIITTVFGQVDGKLQTTTDTVKEGKNPGKKNATTPAEQAEKEAKAEWLKKKKAGYVESLEAAKAGEVDKVVGGGIVPMLAEKFRDFGHKLVGKELLCSGKRDGIRCIVTVEGGKPSFWSRTRRPLIAPDHISAALKVHFPTGKHILDGELYTHKLNRGFEKIVSLVKRTQDDSGQLEYHIFDYPSCPGDFLQRLAALKTTLDAHDDLRRSVPLVVVEQIPVSTQEDIDRVSKDFLSKGYEGAMVRLAHGEYEHKRTQNILKVKPFIDDEFPIVGIEEGRGKLQGHVGKFICRLPDGRTFPVHPRGTIEMMKTFFDDHSTWMGKTLTVQYQNLTADGIPRICKGIRFRDSEDF